MFERKEKKAWRNGVYLATAKNSLEADILESKLRSEGIPMEKKYQGASNALEIIMGNNVSFPIDLYVPEECLEDAKNIIVPVNITDEDFEKELQEKE
ncbi:putative signal transducing protein [Anaerovorax sp. IOR16]|uniref:putative signal transducing protein n=1 Tax=Anaerovorax sp. IOR16 TaxID=2773458 RepID=UPI0019D0BD1A|nr:DUF2007 domain-containing protein [Anaerovorax sp. IOR16]